MRMRSLRRRGCDVNVVSLMTSLLLGGAMMSAQEHLELAGAFGRTAAGPIEREARLLTSGDSLPARALVVPPVYPAEAAAVDARGAVTLRVTIDDFGNVVEARLADVPLLAAMQRAVKAEPETETIVFQALVRAAIEAVRQWRYEVPVDAPVVFDVVVTFSSDSDPKLAEHLVPPPPSAPPDPLEPGKAVPGPPPAWTLGVIRSANLLVPPVKVTHVMPVVPDAALKAGVRRMVVVEARIEPDGRVLNARVVLSIPELDQAVLDAVLQWEFTPRIVDGVAVPVLFASTFELTAP